ncbi:MAG: hypothetical protein M1347_06265 [Chloroflexi bacterium]|nr:hypothetical protein [Chloroflexota bacterium]
METRIAFATYQGFPSLTDDDRLAAEALARRGVQVEAALWTDSAVDWSSYSAVVIRSCWDYHLKADEFRAWLDRLERGGVPLWNPYKVVHWNMDKAYLSDLQGNGIPMLDSVWLPGGAKADLSDLMRQKGWGQAVVKPMISAAANDTDIIPLEKAGARQRELEGLLKKGGVIVQDFAEEITSGGEWSLIFFNRKYSHAVIKRPQEGDFRVQRDFGGTTHPIGAPNHLVQQAKELLDTLGGDLLYARVDGIERNGVLTLMELELIEPHLFFELHPQAADRFADALIETLSVKE